MYPKEKLPESAFVYALLLFLRERLTHLVNVTKTPEFLFLVFSSSFDLFLGTSTQVYFS
nr:MAG TPA: hypothetical protein [Caudoviricetes sp.]